MRLIHTKKYQLKEFAPNEVPGGYAILSHRWLDKQEISFQEMLQPDRDTTTKMGYIKILRFCERAARDNFDYAWIDTCCINKESSAELSTALNSMFRWYQTAAKCYVYLHDVEHISQLSRSEWFQRGWTLQELLAPENIQFFSKNWIPLGYKKDLIKTLAAVTRIPERDLTSDVHVLLMRNSIARKMSWASHRKTKEPEDMAYCLMGIFGVNMSIQYGEGGAEAFLRLQQNIINISSDTTIFAWTIPLSHRRADFGLLAPSVGCFVNSHEIDGVGRMSQSFYVTNEGLHITLRLRHIGGNYYAAYINSESRRVEDRSPTGPLGIYLVQETASSVGSLKFCRVGVDLVPASLRKKLTGAEFEKLPWQSYNICVRQRDHGSSYPLPGLPGGSTPM